MPAFSEAQLLSAVAGFSWVLVRISALFVALPLFAGHLVPAPVRVLLSLATSFLIWPVLPAPPAVELFSLAGLLIDIQQFLIGLAMGFILQLAFAAIIFGGQSVAYGMGLGFASMVDPTTGIQVPVIAQFYQMLSILLFLILDGHLLVVQLLVESFSTFPIGRFAPEQKALWDIALWMSKVFAAGLLLSLPIVTALLIVNLGFGIATRAAPQLNIFSVGFPVSLLLGIVLMDLTLPDVLKLFSGFLDSGYQLIMRLF
jgi:flagellar biosynthetic protein FliR